MVTKIDNNIVNGFGDEWRRFNLKDSNILEAEDIFSKYFHLFNWEKIDKTSVGVDICYWSGRWAKLVTPNIHLQNVLIQVS